MKNALVFLLLVVALSLAGCKQTSAPQAQTTPTNSTSDQLPNPAGGTTLAPEIKFFRGSIGSALGLQMKLIRDGEKLTGNYFYHKVGTNIDVRGTIDKDGHLLLEEFEAGGKQTGTFKGIWKTDNEDGLISIAGNWTKPNGDKQTAFSLHQEPIEFTGPVEIIAKQIKESNKKLNYKIDAEYPQLTGSTDPNFAKFNQHAKGLVTREVSAFRKSMTEDSGEAIPSETGSDIGVGYLVAFANDNLISIQFDTGSYHSGAAHPSSHSQVLNFDLKNGKPLKLADLFKPGAKYLQTIAAYCIKDLKKQSKAKGVDGMLEDDWIERGGAAEATNYESWTITKHGLGVNFDSYQVGPYAAGPQFVLIPYQALKEIILPEGPVAQFMK